MFNRDNWLTWFYDGIEKGPKVSMDSKFDLKIVPSINRPVKTYKEELLINAATIRDSFSEPLDFLFSGGMDSEVALRCFHELKIPINVFIFKYENDYNAYDLSYALEICQCLNINPKVVNFNLQHFFENDAFDIWKTGYYFNAGRLPHMKMLDYLDNIPIMGEGDPWWVYEDNEWKFILEEHYHSMAIYGNAINRSLVADWYEFCPEVLVAHAEHPLIRNFMKQNSSTLKYFETRFPLYKSFWYDLKPRLKFVGFEGTLKPGMSDSKPDFMLDFNKKYITGRPSEKFLYSKKAFYDSLFVKS